MLSVFQTSSPSYVLMASIDSCIRQLAEHGDELFDHYIRILCHFREQAQFAQIEVLQTDDPSLILLRARNISARKLYELLRDRYHLQPEMLAPSYVLMLTSVCDSEEGFDRLLQALQEICTPPVCRGPPHPALQPPLHI
jgi:arginine/lysine/ornithine decarboxylase